MLGRRNVLRNAKQLRRTMGFEPPARKLHAARHSYASNSTRQLAAYMDGFDYRRSVFENVLKRGEGDRAAG
jgi:hypothetical protein